MYDIRIITQGTDFTLRVRAKRLGYNSFVKVAFSEIANIQVNLVSLPSQKTPLSYSYDEYGRLIIPVDGQSLDCNTYGLEITGFYNNGNWRQMLAPVVQVVNSSQYDNYPAVQTDEVTIDLDVTLGETYVSSRSFAKTIGEMENTLTQRDQDLESTKGRVSSLESAVETLPASIPTKTSELTNDSSFQTQQQVSTTVQEAITASRINDAEAILVEDGGEPELQAGISGQKIILLGKNLKGQKGEPFTWDDLTEEQKDRLTGPQGIPGSGAIWSGNEEVLTELEQTTGNAANKTMSQQAITKELRPVKRILNDFSWVAKCMHPATPSTLQDKTGMRTSSAYPVKVGDKVVVDTANNGSNTFTAIAFLTAPDQVSNWAIKASYTYTDGQRHRYTWTANADGYVRVCGYASDMDAYIQVGDSLATQSDLNVEKARIDDVALKIAGGLSEWTMNVGTLHPSSAAVVLPDASHPTRAYYRYSNFVTLNKGDKISVKTYFPESETFAIIAKSSTVLRSSNNQDLRETFIVKEYTAKQDGEQIRISVYVGENADVEWEAKTTLADALIKRKDIENLIDGGLPEYWKTYLDSKMPSITVPAGGDSFLFLTDTHYSENYGNSTQLVEVITKKYPFCKVIHGGDSCSTGFMTSNDGVPKTYEQLVIRETKAFDRLARLASDYARFYAVRGNHDFNEYNNGNKYYHSPAVSSNHIRKVIDDLGVVDGNATERLYYYVDNIEVDVKIRYIFIDSNDGNNNGIGIGITQLQWIATTLTNTPSGYKVVIVGHAPMSKYFAGSNETYLDKLESVRSIMLAYNARESGTEGSVEYDFTGANASIILFLHGHTHIDNQAYHEGIPFVGTMCDKYNHHAWSPFGTGTDLAVSPKQKNSNKEQAIEAVVINADKTIFSFHRIGIGYDRHFHVGKVEVAVGDTHTFTTSKITAATWMICDEDVASNNAKNTLNTASSDYVIPTKNDYATIDSSTGEVTAVAAGDVIVFAEDEDHNKEFFHIKVVAE